MVKSINNLILAGGILAGTFFYGCEKQEPCPKYAEINDHERKNFKEFVQNNADEIHGREGHPMIYLLSFVCEDDTFNVRLTEYSNETCNLELEVRNSEGVKIYRDRNFDGLFPVLSDKYFVGPPGSDCPPESRISAETSIEFKDYIMNLENIFSSCNYSDASD